MNKEIIKHLKALARSLGKYNIPYQTMTSWNRSTCEGFNEGISLSLKEIYLKIKRLEKQDEKSNGKK